MVERRKFLKVAGAAGVAGLTGLSGCTGGETAGAGTTTGAASDATKLTFVLTPAESDVDVKKQYEPMFEYLESEADVSIESSVAADYAAVFSALEAGQADVADASPAIAIQSANENVAEVVGIRVAYGASRYFSLITTTPDSGIEELSDLKGETVAFADRLSTSGSLFPLAMLAKAGLDTGNAPDGKPVDFTGQWSDHSQARETLIARDSVKAAGTGAFSTAPHVPKEQFPQEFLEVSAENDGDLGTKSPELQLLATSDPIPRAPIIVRSGLNADVKTRVEDALLSVTESDLINEDLPEDEQLWFTGVDRGSIEDYQPVVDVLDTLGVTLGQ